MKMEQCSETSAYKLQTPGNYPEESIQQNSNYILSLNNKCLFSRIISAISVKNKQYSDLYDEIVRAVVSHFVTTQKPHIG